MVANVISVAHFTVMAGDRHGELAAKDLSMIAVALTPSSFLLIQQLCHFTYIFHHFCLVFEHETTYIKRMLVSFDFCHRT